MNDKKIPPSVAEFAAQQYYEHPLQYCLRENHEHIAMAATITQQAELIRSQAEEIDRLTNDKTNVIQQASIQAQEARTQRAIVMEIGAMVDCTDDWLVSGAVSAALKRQSAGVVMPNLADDRQSDRYRNGWNACLEEVARLNAPAPDDPAMVKVPRELLCRVSSMLSRPTVHSPASVAKDAAELRALLAQQEVQS